ncbi:class I adenylate-forming enzyme family protein [Thermodesulfobacteriota bacterium]
MNAQQSETIYSCFEAIAKRNPGKTALVYLGTEWTYAELHNLVERTAVGLKMQGLKKGDRVLLYLPNIPQWVISFLAVQRLNAVAVAVSPVSTPIELSEVVDKCRPEILICTDTNFGYALGLFQQKSIKKVLVASLTELLPWWKRLINKLMKLNPEGRILQDENISTFRKLQQTNPSSLPSFEGKGDDVAFICYTSGTLGRPKALPFSSNALLESITAPRLISESLVGHGQGVTLLGRPLYDSLGILTALAGLIYAGDTLLLVHEENADALMSMIQKYGATHLLGSPDFFRGLIENPRTDQYDLSSLKYCFTGGDSLPIRIAEGWGRKFEQPLYTSYVVTEACGPVAIAPPDDQIPAGTAGKIIPGKKIKFIDQESGEEVPPGEPGEVLVSSDSMVRTYWESPEETKKSFLELDGQSWFRTGDIGRLDDHGWFFFLSRSTDIITHQGHRIIAPEIERVLEDHPAVVRASVVGVTDPNVGERIKSFLVLAPGVKGITSYQLIEWCREKLASHMVPQYIEFRDMLPTSRAGKLLKKELILEEEETET